MVFPDWPSTCKLCSWPNLGNTQGPPVLRPPKDGAQGCFRFANPRVEVKSQQACADEFLNERQHWQEYHPR